jgi:hypothetical protein
MLEMISSGCHGSRWRATWRPAATELAMSVGKTLRRAIPSRNANFGAAVAVPVLSRDPA